MPKSKWVNTLKQTQATDGGGHSAAVYKPRKSNLALGLDDEPPEDAEEWTFGKEVFGHEVDTLHTIELRNESGIKASLLGKLDLSRCYCMRMSLRTPHIKHDTSDVLLRLFPSQIASGMVAGGHVMNVLGFDRFFWSIETGCSVFDVYMTDGRLALTSYAGSYGGRGNLRPLHSYYPLEVIPTPEWIWTPEKP